MLSYNHFVYGYASGKACFISKMSSDQVRRDFVRVLNQIDKLDSKINKIQSRITTLERDKYLKEEELKLLNERIKICQQEFSNKTRRTDWLRLTRQKVSVKNKILQLSRKVISEKEEKGNIEIQRSKLIQEQNLLQFSIHQEERGESSTNRVEIKQEQH